MSGDYSKRPFDPAKDYGDVLLQQGRVLLDSDWNEAVEMQSRRWRAGTRDFVGRCGTPQETPDGFRIGFDEANVDLTIGIGRLYVDGLLAENHGAPPFVFDPILAETRGLTPFTYHNQPYYPTARDDAPLNDLLPGVGVVHLVYLDVWQREVIHLQDPSIIEKAVGVDASTRLQTVWQVRVLEDVADAVECGLLDSQLQGWAALIRPSAGRLTTRVSETPETPDPCLIPPSGGYRGVENRLYRVEIHRKADGDGPWKFKFSRDNGAVAAKVVEILAGGTQVKVDLLGRDKVMTFKPDNWIEILDDRAEFRRPAGVNRDPGEHHEDRPTVGVMRRIVNIHPADRILTLHAALPTGVFDPSDAARHTLVRRWDQGQDGQVVDDEGLLDVPAGPIELEDGIEIEFSLDPGIADGAYKEGDYWLFAARAVDGSVEELQQAPPRGVHHHYCRLALLARDANEEVIVHDGRWVFPPLNAGPLLAYVGGDGQDADQDGVLPQPLEVAVFNGEAPVVGAKVRFRIVVGAGGRLSSGVLDGPVIDVDTDAGGVARCNWTLEKAPGNPSPPRSQVVEASLLGGNCEPAGQPIRFNGSLSNISLRYVSGDGQEARVSSVVPGRLIVGVEDGIGRPLQGVPVTFSVDQGGGQVRPVGGALGNTLTVNTGPDGLVECEWQLGADPSVVNLVIAKLSEPPQGPFLPVIFRGVIETPATAGGKCTVTLGVDGVNDLNHALGLLPPEGGCICIPSREFVQTQTVDLTDRRRVTFEGCGPASIINFAPQEAAPLFVLRNSSEIHFHHFRAIGRGLTSAVIDIGTAHACEVRDCWLQGAEHGILAEQGNAMIRELTVANCQIEAQRICIAFLHGQGRVDALLLHRNRLASVEGVRTRELQFLSGEISDNAILAKAIPVVIQADELQFLRNRVTNFGDGFGVSIDVNSEIAKIRVADNTILSTSADGLSCENQSGQLHITGNRIEVRKVALAVHTARGQPDNAKAHIADNVFVSSENEMLNRPVVQCGPPGRLASTKLEHLQFTSNHVRSQQMPTVERPTVFLSSRALICTNNLVHEPDTGAMLLSIQTPVEPSPRGIMANNLTMNGVSSVDGFTGGNVDPF